MAFLFKQNIEVHKVDAFSNKFLLYYDLCILMRTLPLLFFLLPPVRNEHPPVHGVSDKIVGVLGGGQLGRMLCEAASELAIKVVVLDPMENCPASSLAHDHMVGSFDDSANVQEFAKRLGFSVMQFIYFISMPTFFLAFSTKFVSFS